MFCGCQGPSPTTDQLPLSVGEWSLVMDAENTLIPLRLFVTPEFELVFFNGDERINTGVPGIKNDSLYIELPVYGTYLTGRITSSRSFEGFWHYPQRSPDYVIPFTAEYIDVSTSQESDIGEKSHRKFEVRFSPESDDEYPAVGLFEQRGNKVTGTFLTETGDYRFLEGLAEGDAFWMSCFDGAHLFYFDGSGWESGQLLGNFYSGKHWQEPWVAAPNPTAKLTHPDSLTYLIDPLQEFQLNLVRTDGEFVSFANADFREKVTIVQIFGSWCPNCLDESLYYNELYSKYQSQGLQVIPVAFERSEDFETSSHRVKRYLTNLDITYPGYIGGQASKKVASQTFPMLNQIISFPTSIFIDKTGTVRKIHTGFYGPGTGEFYTRYTERTDLFVKQLLSETIDLTAAD